ncbi:MAG: DUF4937 domain-containing protein [Myxococcales bacterium]|nr:DUF4937 domain-containing protein [Myxococcales bacterium]
MRLKHITFQETDREPWIASQRQWLAASIAAGGLHGAFGAEHGGQARVVFLWESDEALRGFMEHDHDRALAEAGTVGRYAALYLDVLEQEGSFVGATYVAESLAWVRDDGIDDWLVERKIWAEATRACDGFVGSLVARGRHACLVTTLWRDRAAHERYLHDVVPQIRMKTDEGSTVRLVRFEAELLPMLTHGAIV